MVDPTSPSLSPSPPPVESYSRPLWPFICLLFAFAVLCLYNKLNTGKWLETAPPRQRPQRREGRVPAVPVPTQVAVKTRNDDVLISFTYKGDNGCAVCLSAFEEGEQVKQMPKCKHCFHARCIDTWLGGHVDCPLCRSVVVAPPVVQPHR